jgi:uncharacterized protein YjbI with pentapeptide repeats
MTGEDIARLDKVSLDNFEAPHSSFPGREELVLQDYLERQSDIDGITTKHAESPEKAVSELNRKIQQWGRVSYNHFTARSLQGLDLTDIIAQFSVFTLADLRGSDMRGMDARSSVGSGVDLKGARLDGADLTHGVYPLANFKNTSLIGVKAVSTVLNLIKAEGADTTAMNLTGAYLLGAEGFTGDRIAIADGVKILMDPATEAAYARALEAGSDEPESMAKALAAKFSTGADRMPGVLAADVHIDMTMHNMLAGSEDHQGSYFRDIVATRGDINDSDFYASVMERVVLQGSKAVNTYLGGVVFYRSDISKLNSEGGRLWLPGSVLIESQVSKTRPENIAGSIFIDTPARSLDLGSTDLTVSGSVFIGPESQRPDIEGKDSLEGQIEFLESAKQLPSKHGQKIIQTAAKKAQHLRELTSQRRHELRA